MNRNEVTVDCNVPYAILMDFEPGTMDGIRAGPSGRPFRVRQLPHRLCAGCGEDGGGRLRLPSRFPVMPLSRWRLRRCHIRGGSRLSWPVIYLVKFQIQDVLKLTVRELDILRIAEEFSTLDSRISDFRSACQASACFPTDSLGAHTNMSMTADTLRTFLLFEDFATINHRDCFEVKWSRDMTTLPTRFVCISCRTLLTSCALSVVAGLPTDSYVDKIGLEPPANSSEGPCSSFPWSSVQFWELRRFLRI